MAAPDGTSQWITGPSALADAHRLRAEADAVCVGAGTALADDPRLTVRVVVDAAGRVEATGHLFDGEAETLVATTPAAPAAAVDAWKAAGAEVLICEPTATVGGGSGGAEGAPPVGQVVLHDLTRALGERGVLELLVEGGPRLQASLWAAGLADRLVWYLAPLAIGGQGAPGLLGAGAATLADARRLRLASVDRFGEDLRLVAYPRPTGGAESAPPDPPNPSLTGGR